VLLRRRDQYSWYHLSVLSRRRFFVSEVCRGSAELTGAEAEHLVRVLRAEAGQIYELSDNHDLYLAEIETARKSLVSFRVLEKLAAPPASPWICLMPALFKFDRFEWMVEKAVELGVSAISPFEAVRTERGLTAAASKRRARWGKIARETSQQSRRAFLPEINEPVRFAQAIAAQGQAKILLDGAATAPMLSTLPLQRSVSNRILLMLGPEGGWTDEERAQAVDSGWTPCSLTHTVLRAETAAIAGLAILQAAWLAA
jgi:16S rRNA (uracil1498-N3)-methyltransferase